MLATLSAPTSTTAKGPHGASHWQTSRSLRANRRGTRAAVVAFTDHNSPGTWVMRRILPATGMCTRW